MVTPEKSTTTGSVDGVLSRKSTALIVWATVPEPTCMLLTRISRELAEVMNVTLAFSATPLAPLGTLIVAPGAVV